MRAQCRAIEFCWLLLLPLLISCGEHTWHFSQAPRSIYLDAKNQNLVGPEFIINDPTRVVSPDGQNFPAVASDGTNHLVVWADWLSTDQIFGIRVDAQGNALDPKPFGIGLGSSGGNDSFPAVAFDGNNFLVVWVESFSGGYFSVQASRISKNGTVLEPTPIIVSSSAVGNATASVSFGGTHFLVAWTDVTTGFIYGARIATSGLLLDSTPVFLADDKTPNVSGAPGLAFDGTNFLLLWNDKRNGTDYDLYCERVNTTNGIVVLDVGGIAIATGAGHQVAPKASFDGTNYLVVWGDNRGSTGFDIYGARVSPAPLVLDPGGVPIVTAANDQYDPVIASSGTQHLVVGWEYVPTGSGDNNILGQVVSTAASLSIGSAVDLSRAGTTPRQFSAAVAFAQNRYLAVWHQNTTPIGGQERSDVYGATIRASDLSIGPFKLISGEVPNQLGASAAFDGTNYFVSWVEEGLTPVATATVYGARIGADGTVLDSPSIVIGSAGVLRDAKTSIAFDGNNYFVVWDSKNSGGAADVFGRLVGKNGTPGVSVAVSQAGDDQRAPVTVYDGTSFVVAWQDRRSGSHFDIYAAQVPLAGTGFSGTNIPIATQAASQLAPAISANGSDSFIVWEDHQAADANLYGVRLSAAGAVVDATPIAISMAGGNQEAPHLSYDGQNYLAVWEEQSNGTNRDVVAARVSVTGVVVDTMPFAVAATSANERRPSSFFDGVNHFVMWQSFQATEKPELRGRRVTRGAVLLDGPGAALSPTASPLVRAVGAGNSANQYSIVVHGVPILRSGIELSELRAQWLSWPVLANPSSVSLPEDSPGYPITLSGAAGAQGNTLSYAVTTPSHGALVGTAPSLNYIPNADYFGPDSFTFSVNDGLASSSPATVNISVTAVNDVPVAISQTIVLDEDSSRAIVLAASDTDQDSLSYSIVSMPTHGALTGAAPNLVYIPSANYHGTDSFTFIASDGASQSAPANVSVVVHAVNDLPTIARERVVTTDEGVEVAIELDGVDEDGDALSFSIVSGTTSGTLTFESGSRVIYRPAAHFSGVDSFVCRASDGKGQSADQEVHIEVKATGRAAGCTSAGANASVLLSVLLGAIRGRRRGRV